MHCNCCFSFGSWNQFPLSQTQRDQQGLCWTILRRVQRKLIQLGAKNRFSSCFISLQAGSYWLSRSCLPSVYRTWRLRSVAGTLVDVDQTEARVGYWALLMPSRMLWGHLNKQLLTGGLWRRPGNSWIKWYVWRDIGSEQVDVEFIVMSVGVIANWLLVYLCMWSGLIPELVRFPLDEMEHIWVWSGLKLQPSVTVDLCWSSSSTVNVSLCKTLQSCKSAAPQSVLMLFCFSSGLFLWTLVFPPLRCL